MYNPLNCSSENNRNFLVDDFCVLHSQHVVVPDEIDINMNLYETSFVLMEQDVLFKKARKIARLLEDVMQESLTNYDIMQGRQYLLDILIATRSNIVINKDILNETNVNELVNNVKSLMALYSMNNFDGKFLNKIVSCNIGNSDKIASQYFHSFLDLQWLVLTICYLCSKQNNILSAIAKDVMRNLMILAHYMYDVKGIRDVPFICSCHKIFWKSFEYFVWKACDSETEFWFIFNDVCNGYDDVTFCLWLMQKLVTECDLKRSNYNLLEQKFKSLLKQECQEHKLLFILQMLKPVLIQFWIDNAKIDPYLFLWDYYFKHLNSLSVEHPNTLIDFIKFVDVADESKVLSSYQLFIRMLIYHLKRHPTHWSKIKGRIYSRLPSYKMEDFSKRGVFNITLIFLGLMEANFDESSTKLLELLLPVQKNYSELLAMIYMTLIAKYVRNRKPVDKICEILNNILERVSNNRSEFHIIRNVVEGIEYVMNISDDYQLKQHKLFGTWMNKYIITCQYTDLAYFLNILILVVNNVKTSDDYYQWISSYSKHVAPALREIVNANTPPQLGQLLALLLKCGAENAQLLPYLNSNRVPLKVIAEFISSLLEDGDKLYSIPESQEISIFQMWINCTICGLEISDSVARKVFNFEFLSSLNITGGNNWMDLLVAIENNVQNIPSYKLKQLCDTMFGHLDTFIKHLLSMQMSDIDVTHVYKSIGELLEHCISFIYDKSKASCLLSRLLSIMLLPADILRGAAPKTTILCAVEVNYHKFLIGLFKSDYINDPFIERSLKDLIIKYLPHFSSSNSPILLCFEEETMAKFVLDKINRNFLIHTARVPDDVVFKALKLLHLAIEQCISFNIMQLIVKVTLPGILEILMYNQNNEIAIDILKMLRHSEWHELVQEDFRNSIKYVMEKNLAFNSTNFFQLVNLLMKLIPEDVKSVLPDLKKQITTIEKMRGVGYDNTLRNALYKIENTL